MGESTLVYSRHVSTAVPLFGGDDEAMLVRRGMEEEEKGREKEFDRRGRRVVLDLMKRRQVNLPEIDPDTEVKDVAVEYIKTHDLAQTFFLVNLGKVYDQYAGWMEELRRVKPFYAVKCNPNPHFLYILGELGCNFDCASLNEMRSVLKLGFNPDRIVFANPCKKQQHLRWAHEHGVTKMTFDNTVELEKIKKICPEAELILRISTDDSSSVCRFSMKFGLAPERAEEVLRVARDLHLNVIGVSFHVGSGCRDPHLYELAIADARMVFAQADRMGMPKMRILDLGGGYAGETNSALFRAIAKQIRISLATHFPLDGYGHGVEVIAEPGRYFACSTHTLLTCIYAKREAAQEKEQLQTLYVDDGVYGSFNSILYDHATPTAEPLRIVGEEKDDMQVTTETTIFGPTCDGLDNLTPCAPAYLPQLDIGDFLLWKEMGAYTCAATGYSFNGMEGPLYFYMFQ